MIGRFKGKQNWFGTGFGTGLLTVNVTDKLFNLVSEFSGMLPMYRLGTRD